MATMRFQLKNHGRNCFSLPGFELWFLELKTRVRQMSYANNTSKSMVYLTSPLVEPDSLQSLKKRQSFVISGVKREDGIDKKREKDEF